MWPNKSKGAALTDPGSADERNDADGTAHGIVHGIRFEGEIKGDADLTISGEVKGVVFLPGQLVLVSGTGSVNANITSRVIEVEGKVVGDLKATDRVTIRKTSHVSGDIVAPQIELEEGCQFKGSVKMQIPEIEQTSPNKPKVVGGPGTVRVKSATG